MRKPAGSCSASTIAAAVLAACALVAACGGSSSKPASLPAATTVPSLSSSQVAQLVANASKQRFKITFRDGGDVEMYAQDGNGDSVQGHDDSLLFTTKAATISCDKSSGSYQCTESEGSVGSEGNPFLSVLPTEESALSQVGGQFAHASTRTIAGRHAECVTFSARDLAIGSSATSGEKGSATYCIDKATGTTLEVSSTDSTGKATTSLLVTQFSIPSNSDFRPPATPTTIPPNITIPGGG